MSQFNLFQTMTTTPRTFPQIQLHDVEGNQLHVNELVSKYHLILITIKNTECPACPQLLKMLNMYGLDPNMNTYKDPFTQQEYSVDPIKKRVKTCLILALILRYDTYFIVLCPGSDADVRQVQMKTPFMDYPFISTNGGANELVKNLRLLMPEQEFMPAILEVTNSLIVNSIYIGRGPGQYFHHPLLGRLSRYRWNQELIGIQSLKDASESIHQLKKRIAKCKEGRLCPLSISLNNSNQQNTRPSPETPSVNYNQNQYGLTSLPSELLEIIFGSFLTGHSEDIRSLVKLSGVCRLFYISICNVLVIRLRFEMDWLNSALPQTTNGNLLWEGSDVDIESLDRWSNSEEGVPFRDLSTRISNMRSFAVHIDEWTRHWRPRRREQYKITNFNNVLQL